MSGSSKQNANVAKTSTSPSSQEQPKKDIIVSILLTESTSSLLNLDLPHLEDANTIKTLPAVCSIKAETNLEETNYYGKCSCKEQTDGTRFWFSGLDQPDVKRTDCEKVSSEVAYFSNKPELQESSSSVQFSEAQMKKKKTSNTNDASSSSSLVKLKPTKVYTRPLFTVRSIAHQNRIRTRANDIFVSVINSESSITDSGWVNVCRICHGGKSIGELRAPCRCRGSIALAHLECLERWLKQSANSHCELCQHHYQIVRQPKYGVLKSVFMFLRHPGDHFWELVYDVLGFVIYTPAAIVSTYMLMLLCESAAKYTMQNERNISAHVMAFTAVFGLAAIDFTYSAWLMTNLQKHIAAWRNWYRNNCEVRLILSENKHHRLNSESLVNQVD